ncbi:uncharacterized protein EV420DRAFT_369514 [Desarmillaria tabescens]|uniref:Nephrocystin 3-like N-terminal domain-containing protein n=1 Tax=Armillaria tabescens TaxID=1929756 RepID=A0AA39N5X8_ARMTA|nr:uncharacterized protein EV420DRAFT_369514 [Desarmillaria tabescens]KAK0458658.1 hypothetical protein EV420DRAFT_369514 [Desarmillaria tabescens]
MFECQSCYIIKDVEVLELLPCNEAIQVYMRIAIAGKVAHKTGLFELDTTLVPKWTLNLKPIFDASTVVDFTLCRPRKYWRDERLGTARISVADMFGEEEGYTTLLSHASSLSTGTKLKISYSETTDFDEEFATEFVNTTARPTEMSGKISRMLERLEPIKQSIDALAELHPAARIAWSFLSLGIDQLQKRSDTDALVIDLYETMLSTNEQAIRDEVFRNRERLRPVYGALFKQIVECTFFISGYTNRTYLGALVGHSPKKTANKAAKFQNGFKRLTEQFNSTIVKETLVVTLRTEEKFDSLKRIVTETLSVTVGIKEKVDELILRDDVLPAHQRKPKLMCLEGTRVEVINDVMHWISECRGSMLWCTGVAGTGKSSLMGTLCQALSTEYACGRNRLGSFIRYDRLEYTDSSKLITSIAYSLALFDGRIGRAISQAVHKIGPVLPPSPRVQFDRLLREPLRSIPELLDEGPVVVIIDGLDECDTSTDVLDVLVEGFGPELPFMRLIVSCRSAERISRAFTPKLHHAGITRVLLDTSSKDVNSDIRKYIAFRFSSIYVSLVERAQEVNRSHQLRSEDDAVKELAQRANGLFIWAVAACTFLEQLPSETRLEELLGSRIPDDAIQSLTMLYRTALDLIVTEGQEKLKNADIRRCIRDLLGAIVVAEVPPGLTLEAIGTLVLKPMDPAGRIIYSKLTSVIEMSPEQKVLRLMHKSFDDFLQDRDRSGEEWYIDADEHKRSLARQSLSSLNKFLGSWKLNATKDVSAKQGRDQIPPHIRHYAVLGPAWHITSFDTHDFGSIEVLFGQHFLSWLEVIVTLGTWYLNRFLSCIYDAKDWIQGVDPASR